MTLKFSVIIPSTNSPILGKILEALKIQSVDIAQGEILVIGEDKSGIAEADPQTTFIPTDQNHSCASDKRNIGMRFARGEILIFLDDDCIPRANWLQKHLARQESGEAVVGGAIEFGVENYFQLADNLSAFHDLLGYTSIGYRAYLATANLSIDRSVVAVTGKMMPAKNRADDLEWTVRMRMCGYKLFFEPEAIVYHDPNRRSLKSVLRHWIVDAPDTLQIRLSYPDLLKTPAIAWHRGMYLWGAPFVATWATARTFSHFRSIILYGHTLPMVYLTKLAWCWSAYQHYYKITAGKADQQPPQLENET